MGLGAPGFVPLLAAGAARGAEVDDHLEKVLSAVLGRRDMGEGKEGMGTRERGSIVAKVLRYLATGSLGCSTRLYPRRPIYSH